MKKLKRIGLDAPFHAVAILVIHYSGAVDVDGYFIATAEVTHAGLKADGQVLAVVTDSPGHQVAKVDAALPINQIDLIWLYLTPKIILVEPDVYTPLSLPAISHLNVLGYSCGLSLDGAAPHGKCEEEYCHYKYLAEDAGHVSLIPLRAVVFPKLAGRWGLGKG